MFVEKSFPKRTSLTINGAWRGGVLKHRDAGPLGRDEEAHLAANNVDLFLSRIGM